MLLESKKKVQSGTNSLTLTTSRYFYKHGRIPADPGHDFRITKAILNAIDARLRMDLTAGTPAIVFTPAETSELVDTLNSDDHPWRRLDALSFTKVALVLLYTEPSAAQSEGLFKLSAVLEEMTHGDLRSAFKNAVGQELIQSLAIFFLDKRIGTLPRRWAGLVLVELLETKANRQKLLNSMELPAASRLMFGKLVVEGVHKILKVIAGQIITLLLGDLQGGVEQRNELLLSFMPDAKGAFDFRFRNGLDFPVEGPSSQWEAAFFGFTSDIEAIRDKRRLRCVLLRYTKCLCVFRSDLNSTPMGFYSFAVYLGEDLLGNPLGGLCCDVKNYLSIRVPSEVGRLPFWIDIDMVNIESIKIEPLQDEFGQLDQDQVGLIIHLTDYKESGHLFLQDMGPMKGPNTILLHIYTDESSNISDDLRKTCKAQRKKWNERL